MNHLEALTAEWLDFNGYFTRSAIKVGRREEGGWNGELDVIAYHPLTRHFVHVECSTDADTWELRERKFARKFAIGKQYARGHFGGLEVPAKLDQVLVHAYLTPTCTRTRIGGGRLVTSQELVSEIVNGVPLNAAKSAVPENFPLMRTLQLAAMAGVRLLPPAKSLIPAVVGAV